MKILVTGGAGFIGGNFVHFMLKEHPQDDILCVDALTYAGNMETLAPVMGNPHFKFIKADIADREAIYSIFEQEKPEIIVNFAAHAVSMAFSAIIRFRPTRFTATCRSTVPICSLRKRLLSTHPAHTRRARQVLTCSCRRTTARSACR